ncbi:hypothetical protein PILCRDRAFT_730380 [Piloderma croceum F 1598]|uniref:Uncharacterized protein n=1 Tax=Piloderma croceum (strain F 1598) TaxID=765440 RepID=A0A0C3AHM4_PILCF|nr:hypothetical protein PILCRDRAFT_730380 [Piloderma croceum F 1598]
MTSTSRFHEKAPPSESWRGPERCGPPRDHFEESKSLSSSPPPPRAPESPLLSFVSSRTSSPAFVRFQRLLRLILPLPPPRSLSLSGFRRL